MYFKLILVTSEVTLLRQQLAESLEQISMLRKEKETVSSKAESTLTENEDLKKEIASLQVQLSHRFVDFRCKYIFLNSINYLCSTTLIKP